MELSLEVSTSCRDEIPFHVISLSPLTRTLLAYSSVYVQQISRCHIPQVHLIIPDLWVPSRSTFSPLLYARRVLTVWGALAVGGGLSLDVVQPYTALYKSL